ncbi:exodeoxyribonuclease VII small subunit [Congregibacter brevis]|uniref:Exodeoxyribonuclease VII small subunit n=1 Tax=Congregibacter brevis TaxID=3081201 RepID=A0ABZ0IB87_9GAMM|nr:exodeoxyribonuclease VII small subunit [Congregibacter sp. IMCC45268]
MKTPKKTANETSDSFADISNRIDELTRDLESADIPLERASSVYAEAVDLIKLAQERLSAAEEQVAIIEKTSSPKQDELDGASD